MVARKLFVFFVVAVFSLGLASAGLSAGMGKEEKIVEEEIGKDVMGVVTKIEGDQVSIMDKMGNEKTIVPTNPGALTDLKVGDQASVKDGILVKMGPPAPSSPKQ